jgi:hypothetical protein
MLYLSLLVESFLAEIVGQEHFPLLLVNQLSYFLGAGF